MERWILHVDMDAFFAAVEQRDHGEYRDRPVIVGGLGARGVVSTASYEARRFGVHSAMPMAAARRRCPDAIFLPGDFPRYRAVSEQIFAILSRFSPLIERLSVDEGFLDLTGMAQLMPDGPRAYGRRIKDAIREETGLIASVGIAPNKFLAKLASDLEKPDGLTLITAADIPRVVWPLPARRIWGVGKKTSERLAIFGYRTIGEIARADMAKLEQELGERLARHLHELALGRDERPVEPVREAQSIGREITFPEDLHTAEEAKEALLKLAGEVGWRLRRAGKRAHTIQLKLRLGDFSTFTRQRTFPAPISYDEDIYAAACTLLDTMALPPRGIRLLGISGSGFDGAGELSLFDDSQKKERLYTAIDGLRRRFGESAVTRAPLLKKPPAAKMLSDDDEA